MEEFKFSLELLDGPDVRSEDRNAEWLRVFRHFQPRLESFYRDRASQPGELDELVAELWRRVLVNISSLRSPRAMWSWMTTIGNNILTDRGRRRAVLARREILWSVAEADPSLRQFLAGWAGERDDTTMVTDVDSQFERLSAEDREFLELFAVDKLNHSEIAQRLGLASASASRQRLCRLRKRLTESLE